MPHRPRSGSERVARRPGRSGGRSAAFPVDVEDHGDEFVVSVDLPGLRKQDVDATVRRDRLLVEADFGTDEAGSYLRKERDRGTARRVIRLPEAVEESRVAASYDDGVLRVALPKRHRPKRVRVE